MPFKIIGDRGETPSEKKGGFDFLIESPQWTLGEVTLSKETLDKIDEMIAYINYREKLLIEWEFNRFLKMGSGLSVNFLASLVQGRVLRLKRLLTKWGCLL